MWRRFEDGKEIMRGVNLRNLELYNEYKLPSERPYFDSEAFLSFLSGIPFRKGKKQLSD